LPDAAGSSLVLALDRVRPESPRRLLEQPITGHNRTIGSRRPTIKVAWKPIGLGLQLLQRENVHIRSSSATLLPNPRPPQITILQQLQQRPRRPAQPLRRKRNKLDDRQRRQARAIERRREPTRREILRPHGNPQPAARRRNTPCDCCSYRPPAIGTPPRPAHRALPRASRSALPPE